MVSLTGHLGIEPLQVEDRAKQRARNEADEQDPSLGPDAVHGRSVHGDERIAAVKRQEVGQVGSKL